MTYTMNSLIETKRKELQFVSYSLFALIALRIVDVLDFIMGMNELDTSAMDPQALAAIPLINGLGIAIGAVSVIVLAILGVKGLREVNKPSSSRYHIVLAFLAAAGFGLGFISEIAGLFSGAVTFNNVGPVLISGLFVIDTLHYAMTAKALRVKK